MGGPKKGNPEEHALHALDNGVVVIDVLQPHWPVIFANDSFLTLVGTHRHEVIDQTAAFISDLLKHFFALHQQHMLTYYKRFNLLSFRWLK